MYEVTVRVENDADASQTVTVDMIIGDLAEGSSFKDVQWASSNITVPAASSDGTPGSVEETVTLTPSDHNGPAQYGIAAESDGAKNAAAQPLEIVAREGGTEQREIEEPDPQEFSGNGKDVVTFTAQGGMTVLDTQHDGDSNFQVEILGSSGGLVGIPVRSSL